MKKNIRLNQSPVIITGVMVIIAALLFGYATYAWVTMSRSLTATGIELKVSAPNNIQISLSGGVNNAEWSENVDLEVRLKEIIANQVPGFNSLKDNFFIMPASTYSGINGTIFATTRARTDGSAYEDTLFYQGRGITHNDAVYDGHYVDVPLFFRTADVSDVPIKLAKNYNGEILTAIVPLDGGNIAKTARVAFLSEDATKTSNGDDNTVPLVYANGYETDSDYINGSTKTVVTGEQSYQTPKYLSFTGNDIIKLSNETLFTLNGATYENGEPRYSVKKIVVRIWIEGQDANCVVNIGKKSFSVNLGFTGAN